MSADVSARSQAPAGVTYDIGADDVIVSVGGGWNAFATANETAALCSGVVGRSIWDFIDGATPRQVYRDLLARVRSGHGVCFPFRCDSPTHVRHMVMQMTTLEEQGVRFETSMIRAVPATGPHLARPLHQMVRECSWCKRVALPSTSDFLELEVAIARYHLLDGDRPIRITHGICDACLAMLDVDLGHV